MKKTENKEIPRWKDDMLKRLKEEEQFDKWAVETLRASRKGRHAELKKGMGEESAKKRKA